MQFEYYVLNYDINKNKVIPYNIFRNINVQECTEKEIKKYLRNPKNYTYKSFDGKEEIYGFDALVKEIDKFNTLEELKEELEKLDKRTARLKGTDCYEQCNKNMPMIVRECIWQYKQQKKTKDGE